MSITPTLERLFLLGESSFRGGGSGAGGKIAAADPFVAFDITKQISEKVSLPEPLQELIEVFQNTQRNVGKIKTLGYNPGESSITFDMLTGMFLYYALGGVVTAGTALGTPFADTIASGQGTAIITMTTHGAMTPDEHIGRIITIDSTYVYSILDNDATTITLDRACASDANGDAVVITEAPYTHTITESNTLPSFALHYEHYGKGIEIDLLGCLIKSIEIVIEAGAETPVQCTLEIMSAKSLAGDALTEPSVLALDSFVRGDVNTYSLTYNSVEIDTSLSDNSDKIIIKIENDFDIKKVMSDAFPNRVVIGTRNYSVTYSTAVQSSTWYDIQKLKVPNYASFYGNSGYYATAIASTTKWQRSATDYIQVAFNKLYQKPTEELTSLVSWSEKELYIPIEFGSAPGNACTITVVDALNSRYYERGQ